jgi:hypothetical protein
MLNRVRGQKVIHKTDIFFHFFHIWLKPLYICLVSGYNIYCSISHLNLYLWYQYKNIIIRTYRQFLRLTSSHVLSGKNK